MNFKNVAGKTMLFLDTMINSPRKKKERKKEDKKNPAQSRSFLDFSVSLPILTLIFFSIYYMTFFLALP